MNYYTTPFWDTNNAEILNAYNKYSQKANYWCGQIGPGYLQNMQPNETLLINGHGATGSLQIAETSNGTGGKYAVQQIAQWLITCGLPTNHVKIKMLGCQTADFARYLAMTLGRTHPNIVVGGYVHEIYIGNGHRSLIRVPTQQHPVPNTTNSGYVVWYNAQGNPVPKP